MNEEKNNLYQLIMRQLRKDGYTRAAELLSDTALIPFEEQLIASDDTDLEAIVHHHYLTNASASLRTQTSSSSSSHSSSSSSHSSSSSVLGLGESTSSPLDMQSSQRARKPVLNARFTTKLQGNNAVGSFSWDGSIFACGSSDGSIRVIDGALACREGNNSNVISSIGEENNSSSLSSSSVTPIVLKTLLDHTDAVTDVALHPRARVLLSSSKDKSIRMFSYTGMSSRSFDSIGDTHPVKCISLHPNGDYLLAACKHPYTRMYCVEQPHASPMISLDVAHHHTGPLQHVTWACNASYYATCSSDGHIKLWDTQSSRVMRTLPSCHSGARVYSCQISRSGHYVLSSGDDGQHKLHDTRTGALLRVYKKNPSSSSSSSSFSSKVKVKAFFVGANEEYVAAGSSEDASSVTLWDTVSASVVHRQAVTQGDVVTSCVWQPLQSGQLSFVSCSHEGRVVFWTE